MKMSLSFGKIAVLICLCLLCIQIVIYAQDMPPMPPMPPDSIRPPEPEQTDTIVKEKIIFEPIPDADTLSEGKSLSRVIDQSIKSDRFSYSLAESFHPYSGFEVIKQGSFGQPEYLFYGGLPIDRFAIGDFTLDYSQFGLPVNSLVDSRFLTLGQTDLVYFDGVADCHNFFTPQIYRQGYVDSGALTSAYMQKGDNGFSNTMVKFQSNAGSRAQVGFSADFKRSNGYADNQEKDLENYHAYTNFQLSKNYQMQSELLFLSTDDNLRFLNYYSDYDGNSKAGMLGLSVALAGADIKKPFHRIAFTLQRFSESVRGSHDKFRTVFLKYVMKLENGLDISGWESHITVEPYIKSIRFEPEKTNYAGIDAYGKSNLNPIDALNINISAGLSASKYADGDLSLAGGFRYSSCPCLALSGQVFRITRPPADFELFADSPEFGLTGSDNDSVYYSITGNDDLRNTDYLGYVMALEMERGKFSAQLYIRQAEINNLTFWNQDTESASPYQTDAEWLMGGVDFLADLPLKLESRLSYSYGRLKDSDSDDNLTLTPRHKIYLSFARNLVIPKLNLDFRGIVEGEYHSSAYRSPYNDYNLGDYALMTFKLYFKIKTLTIYYNMDNLFNKPYRNYAGYELRRSVWWGFLWNFMD